MSTTIEQLQEQYHRWRYKKWAQASTGPYYGETEIIHHHLRVNSPDFWDHGIHGCCNHNCTELPAAA